MGIRRLAYPACAYAGKLEITPQDVIFLRKFAFPEGLTGNEDALAVLEIHRAPSAKSAEWNVWFVEAMADFIVNQAWPQGTLDETNARWLIRVVAPKGIVNDPVELELLLHAIELSRSVPDFLSALALDQLRHALATGKGAYAGIRKIRRPGVSNEDAAYLMRILRGACNHGEITITRREAKVLASIEKLAAGQICHPDWETMLASVRENGVHATRSASPWLALPENGSRVA